MSRTERSCISKGIIKGIVMKTSIFCKKCIVSIMCHKECDKIRKIRRILNQIGKISLFTFVFGGAVGFAVILSIEEAKQYTNQFLIVISVLEIVSFSSLITVATMVETIIDRFT